MKQEFEDWLVQEFPNFHSFVDYFEKLEAKTLKNIEPDYPRQPLKIRLRNLMLETDFKKFRELYTYLLKYLVVKSEKQQTKQNSINTFNFSQKPSFVVKESKPNVEKQISADQEFSEVPFSLRAREKSNKKQSKPNIEEDFITNPIKSFNLNPNSDENQTKSEQIQPEIQKSENQLLDKTMNSDQSQVQVKLGIKPETKLEEIKPESTKEEVKPETKPEEKAKPIKEKPKAKPKEEVKSESIKVKLEVKPEKTKSKQKTKPEPKKEKPKAKPKEKIKKPIKEKPHRDVSLAIEKLKKNLLSKDKKIFDKINKMSEEELLEELLLHKDTRKIALVFKNKKMTKKQKQRFTIAAKKLLGKKMGLSKDFLKDFEENS